MKRKVNRGSSYHKGQEYIEEHRHPLEKKGATWGQEEDDLLLECWLVRELSMTSLKKNASTMQSVTGRREHAIHTRLWKLAANYEEARDYLPGPGRTDRAGTPFTQRDWALAELATGDGGRANGAHLPSRLAAVLARGEAEVKAFLLEEAQLADRGLRKRLPATGEASPLLVAQLAYKSLRGSYYKLSHVPSWP